MNIASLSEKQRKELESAIASENGRKGIKVLKKRLGSKKNVSSYFSELRKKQTVQNRKKA